MKMKEPSKLKQDEFTSGTVSTYKDIYGMIQSRLGMKVDNVEVLSGMRM